MSEVASAYKIAYHREKVAAYLAGEPIFPSTLELDITSRCTRTCTDCPSNRSTSSHHLPLEVVRSLFASLQGQTRGLLLTGGEPTVSPDFAEVLRLAREHGFLEVAVVTNGSLLAQERVAKALIDHASTIRISAYDWDGDSLESLSPTLQRVERLRKRADSAGSQLRIGVSALTSRERAPVLPALAELVHAAGAHWIYFHPMCSGWGSSYPAQVDQDGVKAKLDQILRAEPGSNGFEAFMSRGRYSQSTLEFDGYHAAHFLLVIGADGRNYLAPEVKYHPDHVIADLNTGGLSDFLWQRERLERIRSVTSRSYPALRSRHRGVLYNDFLERIRRDRLDPEERDLLQNPSSFRFPHIL